MQSTTIEPVASPFTIDAATSSTRVEASVVIEGGTLFEASAEIADESDEMTVTVRRSTVARGSVEQDEATLTLRASEFAALSALLASVAGKVEAVLA